LGVQRREAHRDTEVERRVGMEMPAVLTGPDARPRARSVVMPLGRGFGGFVLGVAIIDDHR
jgi:hypothetical protein